MMDKRSEANLVGVHPDLVRVVRAVFEDYAKDGAATLIVTEGVRTREKQAELVRAGASRTMNSRHLTGHAVDFAIKVGGEVRWDWPLFEGLGNRVKRIAKEMGVPVVWGGDWANFRDGPHFELEATAYPRPTTRA